MKKSIKRNNPPKAFLGTAMAIASAISSIAGSAISASNARRANREQVRMQNHLNAIDEGNALSELYNGQYANQEELDRMSNMEYKYGGKRKLKYGGHSSTGGVSQVSVGSDITAENKGDWYQPQPGFYLNINGPSHEQGGINIKAKSNKKTQAQMETNEGVYQDGDKFYVITDKLVNHRTGETYLQDVLNGRPYKKVGREQESDKKNIISNNKAEDGIIRYLPNTTVTGKRRFRSPIGLTTDQINNEYIINEINKREQEEKNEKLRNYLTLIPFIDGKTFRLGGVKKAKWGWTDRIGKSDMTYGDAYNAGIQTIGNIASGIINATTYRNMEASSAPSLVSRSSLKTRYNIAPQLATLSNARYNTNDYINRNSISSAASREAVANSNMNYALQANQLWGDKTNKEVELVNANTRYLDEGRELNAQKMSAYNQSLVDYRNQKRAGIASAYNNMITGFMNTANAVDQNINTRLTNRANASATLAQGNPQVLAYWAQTDPDGFKANFGKDAYNVWVNYIINPEEGYAVGERLGGRKSLKRK